MVCLPTELILIIIDLLHDDPEALRRCCLASKSFIDPTRTHLFKRVYFKEPDDLQAWKECFPVPERSPSTFTKDLRFDCAERVEDERFTEWIQSFTNVVRLEVSAARMPREGQGVFTRFHSLSLHGVKSLTVGWVGDRGAQEVFDFICSFPLLEDLRVVGDGLLDRTPNGNALLPKLTGTFAFEPRNPDFMERFLNLPVDLHFREIVYVNQEGDEYLTELVERCSNTLECVEIKHDGSKSSKSPPPTTGRLMT